MTERISPPQYFDGLKNTLDKLRSVLKEEKSVLLISPETIRTFLLVSLLGNTERLNKPQMLELAKQLSEFTQEIIRKVKLKKDLPPTAHTELIMIQRVVMNLIVKLSLDQ